MRHTAGLGLALALTSAATFGSSGSFASSLIAAGWTPGAAVLTRLSVAAAILTVPALLQLRGRWAVFAANVRTVLMFGTGAMAVAQLCFFEAVQRIPVGVALLMEYLGTVLVVGWTWLRHGQRPGALTLVGGAVSLGGLVLVLEVGGVHHLDLVGVLWGLGAAVGLATYFVVSAATHDALPPLALSWAGLAIGSVALAALAAVGVLPLAASTGDVVLAGHRTSWLVPVVGLAVVAAVVAYLAGIAAARLLGARLASFVGLAEVLAAVALAWALLGQVPAPLQFVGGALVVVGVALVRVGEQRSAEADEPQPVTPVAAPA